MIIAKSIISGEKSACKAFVTIGLYSEIEGASLIYTVGYKLLHGGIHHTILIAILVDGQLHRY